MPDENSARRIAEQVVASADSVAYLSDCIGRAPLPAPWCYGPSFDVRLRFRPRLSEMTDTDLSRRLDAIGVAGPLRRDRLVAVAERRSLQVGDLAADQPWRPQAFGLWRLDDGSALGVKVYASSRPPVDLLLAVPPGFLDAFGVTGGFGASWQRLADRPERVRALARVCAALHATLRRAQPVASVEAAHVQDQAWCESLHAHDRGLIVPCPAADALGGTPVRDGWVGLALE